MAAACNAKAVYRRIDVDRPLMNPPATGCDGLAQPGRRAAVDSSSALFLDQTMAEPAILDKCGDDIRTLVTFHRYAKAHVQSVLESQRAQGRRVFNRHRTKTGIGPLADRFCRSSIGMLAAVVAFGIGPAAAQDFTAGKTPAQLFQSDCTACHKSPAGLAKGRDTRTLISFLREHYTTKQESAAALAGYLGGAGRGPAEGRPKPPPPATAVAPNPAAKPKPVQRSAGEANPNAPANAPHEERRAARPPAAGHDAEKSETEETIRKLNGYAAAAGSAYDTERGPDMAKRLESYAGAGSAADTLTPADEAKPKAETKQKKKSTTSASASPSPPPATATHPPAPHRPPSNVMPRPAGNN